MSPRARRTVRDSTGAGWRVMIAVLGSVAAVTALLALGALISGPAAARAHTEDLTNARVNERVEAGEITFQVLGARLGTDTFDVPHLFVDMRIENDGDVPLNANYISVPWEESLFQLALFGGLQTDASDALAATILFFTDEPDAFESSLWINPGTSREVTFGMEVPASEAPSMVGRNIRIFLGSSTIEPNADWQQGRFWSIPEFTTTVLAEIEES